MSYAKLSVEELQGYFSDFHKDYYGFRPRGFGTEEQWNDRDWLIAQIEQIHGAMDYMKSTFAGREELREGGWVVEETEPELIAQAKWLSDERAREYSEWVTTMERNYSDEKLSENYTY